MSFKISSDNNENLGKAYLNQKLKENDGRNKNLQA